MPWRQSIISNAKSTHAIDTVASFSKPIDRNQKTGADACEKMKESRAFVEMTSYNEKRVDTGILLFKLSEIHSMYATRLNK